MHLQKVGQAYKPHLALGCAIMPALSQQTLLTMHQSVFNHLSSVGVASSTLIGCIVALAIVRVHKQNKSNPHFLPSILIVLGLSACTNSFLDLFIQSRELAVWELPNPLSLLVGPLFLLRLNSLNQKRIEARQLILHALPFMVVGVVLMAYLLSPQNQHTRYNHLLEHGLRILSFAAFLQVALYLYLCRSSLARYRARLEQNCSSLDKINQDWIVKSLISLLTAFTLLTLIYGLNHHHVPVPINKSFALIYAFVTCYLCFLTITRPILLGSASIKLTENLDAPQPNHEDSLLDKPQYKPQIKYQKSGLDADDLVEMFETLQEYMKRENPYRDPDLNLTSLAAQLAWSPQQLSQCINGCAKLNFYEYINRYRLEAVKQQLRDPALQDNSILNIAFEAGFNSKATFNRYFKAQLGFTPSDYRKSQNIG